MRTEAEITRALHTIAQSEATEKRVEVRATMIVCLDWVLGGENMVDDLLKGLRNAMADRDAAN